MKGNFERAGVIALCAAIGWFYVWTVRSSGDAWNFGKEQRDYYNLLIDGYLAGHLHMNVEVPDAILKLKNPYDPGERPPGLGLHDASFYQGKYYVYFGVAPMVVLMLPFRLITGIDLPQPVAALVFIYGGFLVSAAVWIAVRRRYFPETGTLVVWCGVLVLGLAGLGPVLLRRPHMWELPIGGGYFFAMLALFCVWRSLHADQKRSGPAPADVRRQGEAHLREPSLGTSAATKRAAWWFAGAGLCLGLAIASRPTYLIASPCLAVPLLWRWWKQRRWPWRLTLSAVMPLALVGSAMAWHNHARFENPLEFGQKYQFSLDYESKLPHFRAAYVPYNVRAHFFSGAQWSRYFPFIRRPDLGEAPKGFTTHHGDVYGILIDFPFAWLALLAPLALWRRPNEERGPLGAWIGTVAVLFALGAAVLLSFFSVLARYQMDFMPALMLLACVGLLGLERFLRVAGAPAWRTAARVGWVGAAVFSAAFGIIFSLQFDGLLGERNPLLEQKVARSLNRFPAVVERLLGVQHGSVELTVRFPPDRRPGRETLLTSGQSPRVDRVLVHDREDGRVQLGVARSGGPEQLTRPLVIDPQATHRLRMTMASFYPPASHPFFAGKTPGEIRRLTREVRIELDGEPMLVEHRRAAGTASGQVRVGKEAMVDATYPRFRGAIISVRRRDEMDGAAFSPGAFVRLRLAFKGGTAGGCEPLLSFGEGPAGVLLTVTRLGDQQVKFGVIGARFETSQSEPVAISPGRAHELLVRVENVRDATRRRLYLWQDGGLVFSREVGWDAGVSPSITAGKNMPGITGCAAAFGGEIFSVQQNPWGIDPLVGAGDTLRLRVRLPSGRSGHREPLVVTGRNGGGDLLMVEYWDPLESTCRHASLSIL